MAGDTLYFSQGQVATLTSQFIASPSGQAVDVPDATIEIIGASGSVVLPPTPMVHVMTGFYYYDWIIPNSLPVATYTARYTGTVLGIPTAGTEYIQIVSSGSPTGAMFSQVRVELIAALETYLGCAQRIPVYNELGRRNKSRDTFQLTWPRWNLGNHIVRVNNEPIEDGYAIDSDTGTIRFATPLHDSDRVFASYNFRFFSQTDLLRFLEDALSQINMEPGGDARSLDSIPSMWVGTLMMGASKNAIKKMLMCLQFQEPSTIFGGPELAKEKFGQLMQLKDNNEKEFSESKKILKRGKYPGIRAISQSEFTLPGGRCITPDTISTYMINGEVKNTSILEAFMAFEGQKKIQILSNSEGKFVFSKVSKIWRSTLKRVYELKTKEGLVVFASKEHLFFTKGIYLPLMDLNKGCTLNTLTGPDEVLSITDTGRDEVMFDLEVPETQNFFANGIQCHNSRWFRYLFSGSNL